MNTIDKAPAPQTAAERHDRLGKKVGVAIGALLIAAGTGTALASHEAARHDLAGISADAPQGGDIATQAKAVSEQPVVMSYQVEALGKLVKKDAPGHPEGNVQEALDSATDNLYTTDLGLLTAATGVTVSGLAGFKLRRKH